MVLNWDGDVVPCCFDMNNLFVFGNALENSIKGIWNSENYVNFRKMILKNKSASPLCKNCPGTNKETFVQA